MADILLTISDLNSILQEIYIRTGKDLRDYAVSSMKNRIERVMLSNDFSNYSDFLHKVKKNDAFANIVLNEIYVPYTEMFRDPEMWNAFKKQIIPKLHKKESFKICVPNCTTGEDLYTLLIILDKENLLEKADIEVTANTKIHFNYIKAAEYPIKQIEQIKKNFEILKYDFEIEDILDAKLKEFTFKKSFINQFKITDDNFFISSNENFYDLILFRNKLIYYNTKKQNQTIEFLYERLNKGGFLIIGIGEEFNKQYKRKFKAVNKTENIYKK